MADFAPGKSQLKFALDSESRGFQKCGEELINHFRMIPIISTILFQELVEKETWYRKYDVNENLTDEMINSTTLYG